MTDIENCGAVSTPFSESSLLTCRSTRHEMNNSSYKPAVFSGPGPLPSEYNDGLMKGALYAINVQSPPTRCHLVANTLLANLARGIPCTLMTPLALDEFFGHEDDTAVQALIEAIEDRRLLVFAMQDSFRTKLFRFGADRFVAELENFGTPANSFVMIDHADLLFTREDSSVAVSQAKVYRQWMRKTGSIALMMFIDDPDYASRHNYLRSMADQFSGIANLNIGPEGLEILVDYWTMQRAFVIGKRMAIAPDEYGELHVEPSLIVNRRSSYRSPETSGSVKHFPGNAGGTGSLSEQSTNSVDFVENRLADSSIERSTPRD